jgi:hypothetical protein
MRLIRRLSLEPLEEVVIGVIQEAGSPDSPRANQHVRWVYHFCVREKRYTAWHVNFVMKLHVQGACEGAYPMQCSCTHTSSWLRQLLQASRAKRPHNQQQAPPAPPSS